MSQEAILEEVSIFFSHYSDIVLQLYIANQLSQVHNWLGLSLDFLHEHNPGKMPSSAGRSPENAGALLDKPFKPITTPPPAIITPPASADWESHPSELKFGPEDVAISQDTRETSLSLFSKCG
jgi:hypothetical protein